MRETAGTSVAQEVTPGGGSTALVAEARAAASASDAADIAGDKAAAGSANGPILTRRWVRTTAVVGGLTVIAILIVNFAANVNSPSYPTDDGYIAFSYARTLADHGVLALSPGVAPVQGFSDFLWVVLLAITHLMGLSIPTASRILGIAFDVAVVPVTYVLARRMSPDAWIGFPLVAALVAGFLPGSVFFSLSGLETTLATLLLAVALMDLVESRSHEDGPDLPWIAAIALLGYALVRTEGVVMWGTLSVAQFATLGRPFVGAPIRRLMVWLGVFLVPFGLYLVWQLWYFGSVIPNTVTAKQGTPIGTAVRQSIPYLHGFFVPLGVFTVLAVSGAFQRRRSSLIAASAVVVLVGFALVSAVQDGYPYQRYVLEGAPALLALASAGGWRVTKALASRGRIFGIVGATVLFGVTMVGMQREFAASPIVSISQLTAGRPFDKAWSQLVAADTGPHETVYPEYHSAAAWLRPRARPGQSIALEEIGIIGYYSGLQVIDTFGLADATIAHQPGLPSEKVDIPYVLGRRPTYWAMPIHGNCLCVTLSADVAYAQTSTFAFGYDLVGAFPADPKQVAIFRRRPRLIAVESLDAGLPGATSVTAPTTLAALSTGSVATPAEGAAARYVMRGHLVGVIGTPGPSGETTTLAVDVPSTGSNTFEVGTGPVDMTESGSWTVAVQSTSMTPGLAGTTAVRSATWQPTDLSVPLSRWRGRRVLVTLTYRGSMRAGTAVTFVEPRLVRTAG